MANRTLVLILLAAALLLGGCATKKQIERGRAAMAGGEPEQAVFHYEKALRRKPKLAEDPRFVEDLRVARRDAQMVAGRRELDRDQWLAAIDHFRASLDAEPGYAQAEEGLALANAGAAGMYYRSALRHADAGDLEAARGDLERALSHGPDHADALEALASLDNPGAPAAMGEAGSHAAAGRWDAAIAAYRGLIQRRRNHFPARARLYETLDAAADDTARRGRLALAGDRFDEAEALFLDVGRFRPQHPAIARGLADTDLARAGAAEMDRNFGASLLWSRAAAKHVDDDSSRRGVARSRSALLDRHRLPVQITADGGGARADGSGDIAAAATAAITSRHGAALELSEHGHFVNVSMQRLAVRDLPVDSRRHRHAYQAQRDVPNPAIDDLEYRIHHLRQKRRRLVHRERQLCDRIAYAQHHHHDGQVYQLNHKLETVRRELHGVQRDINRLKYELSCTPPTLVETYTEHFPYTVETHGRVATIRSGYTLDGVEADPVRVETRETDTTIVDPRPELGLRPDPIELTDPSHMQRGLIERAGTEIADRVADAIVRNRVAELDAEAASLATNSPEAARERAVAAAVFMGERDRAAGERRLVALQVDLAR